MPTSTIGIEKIACYGWKNCLRLYNKQIELIVTTDVGPRIIHFGFIGQENEFATYPDDLGRTGGQSWRIYGGHRLWHAPEDPERTYWPDNTPVDVRPNAQGLSLHQSTETTTGIGKAIDIILHPQKAQVQVSHTLTNHNLWPVALAPWALSVMAPGGVGLFPLPPRGLHPQNLLPSSSLTLWPYTNMSDPRWTWGQQLIMLRQDARNSTPQKVGAYSPNGWIAYARAGHLFIKQTSASSAPEHYPDMGSNLEIFTNEDMLEIETLGPTTQLAPDASITHTEHWMLLDNIPQPRNEAEALAVLPSHLFPTSKP